jgi:hypothetical protein
MSVCLLVDRSPRRSNPQEMIDSYHVILLFNRLGGGVLWVDLSKKALLHTVRF